VYNGKVCKKRDETETSEKGIDPVDFSVVSASRNKYKGD
jgi:hypothetical protein